VRSRCAIPDPHRLLVDGYLAFLAVADLSAATTVATATAKDRLYCHRGGSACNVGYAQEDYELSSGYPARLLRGRQRMMFVQDAPPAVNFAKTHRQPKCKGFAFAVRGDVDAPSQCRDEGNIPAASDLHIVKSKGNGLFSR
jgi:hypothetical protein